jgi:putative membrane protein
MEDVPLEVGDEIIRKGRLHGTKQVALIDSHNSIGSSSDVPVLSKEETYDLISAAEEALKYALKEDRSAFVIGVAKVVPIEFSINQGMGPGGIVALAIIVGEQKSLYVTIDGNNMVSGLRDKIIQALSDHFDECEVLTTDTHVVNALTTNERGYYPIGEAIDHDLLISYVKDVALKAKDSVEEGTVSFKKIQINNIRVIGEEKIANLSMLIDLTFNLIKRVVFAIYIPAIIVAILPYLFI